MRITFSHLALAALLIVSAVSHNEGLYPLHFAWGTATASYQVEGAWNVSGKGPSIWDYFTTFPNLIYDNETGQVADDFYDRYLDDITTMKTLGFKHFRLSLSWARLLPNGTVDYVNQAGVDFYNDLINALIDAGITPYVTLYHWDLPQAFNNFTNVSTWLNPDIVQYFVEYANFCFQTFGDRVKYWITFNEPDTFTQLGYISGIHAPGRCSPGFGDWCETVGGGGNSSTEAYIATHYVLLAHGYTVQSYRENYQPVQGGKIGMNVAFGATLPYNVSNPNDTYACEVANVFSFGWYYDPVFFGDYPGIMKEFVGDRLPTFTEEQKQIMNGSWDFLGMNHYTTYYTQWVGTPGNNPFNDSRTASGPVNASGNQIGPQAASTWLYVYPQGMRHSLKWVAQRYGNPPIYIFENGVSCPNESVIPLPQVLNDTFRVNYYKEYIAEMLLAIFADSINVKGYFAWSFMDNFEWTDGYFVRFGLTYVDYANNLTRLLKNSAYYYSALAKTASGEEDVFLPETPEYVKNLIEEFREDLEMKMVYV